MLLQSKRDSNLTIVGPTITADDEKYSAELRAYIKENAVEDSVTIAPAVDPDGVVAYLRRARVFVHTSTTGSLDKAILEALAAGVPVITTSEGSRALPLATWQVSSVNEMHTHVAAILESGGHAELSDIRNHVLERHSLEALIPNILGHYEARTASQ